LFLINNKGFVKEEMDAGNIISAMQYRLAVIETISFTRYRNTKISKKMKGHLKVIL
jgi:hypothetical protein